MANSRIATAAAISMIDFDFLEFSPASRSDLDAETVLILSSMRIIGVSVIFFKSSTKFKTLEVAVELEVKRQNTI